MNLLETPYSLSSLALQQPFTSDEYIVAGGVLALAVTIYFLLPVMVATVDAMVARKKKRERKQALGDLVMMKEIQTEIDEEMKQAMIRSALREKGA